MLAAQAHAVPPEAPLVAPVRRYIGAGFGFAVPGGTTAYFALLDLMNHGLCMKAYLYL